VLAGADSSGSNGAVWYKGLMTLSSKVGGAIEAVMTRKREAVENFFGFNLVRLNPPFYSAPSPLYSYSMLAIAIVSHVFLLFTPESLG
jgi:hypothetical protein